MKDGTYIERSSAQLVEVDEQNHPIRIASGCIVSYKKRRFLLTVRHATGNNGNWAIELEYDQARGMKLYRLGAMNYLKKLNLPKGYSEDIDFAYVEIPNDLNVYRHFLSPQGLTLRKEKVHIYSGEFDSLPNKEESYAFSGCVMPDISSNPYEIDRPFLYREFRCYESLKYERKDGDIFVFKLPFKHPGHKYFKGCSGAPVVDSENELTGLVCSGSTETGEIFVLSLPMIKMSLDATIITDNI